MSTEEQMISLLLSTLNYKTIFLTDVVTFSHHSPPSWLWPLSCGVVAAPFPAPTSDAVSQLLWACWHLWPLLPGWEGPRSLEEWPCFWKTGGLVWEGGEKRGRLGRKKQPGHRPPTGLAGTCVCTKAASERRGGALMFAGDLLCVR